MARIEGVRTNGSLFTRFAFYLSRRKLGKVVKAVQVHALHKRCKFWNYAGGILVIILWMSCRLIPRSTSLLSITKTV